MTEIYIDAMVRPLIVLILCTAIFLILLCWLTGDWQRGGLFLSFFLLLFFTYGHVHGFKEITVGGINILRHKYLIMIWLVLAIGGTVVMRRTKDLKPYTVFANAMSVVMLFVPLFNIGRYLIEENAYLTEVEPQTSSAYELSAPQPAPDVYFIVLDAYGRADVLRDLFELDNSEFIRELQDMGFYVVQCSQSNYAWTQLSIASTLNMDYLQNLVPDLQAEEVKYWAPPLLLHSRVRALFEELGYETVAFYNGYPRTHWQDADYFLQPGEQSFVLAQLDSKWTSFEVMFLNTTFLSTIVDLQKSRTPISSNPSRRESDLYMLATLPKIHKILGPKLIYAHVMLPHPPFIFGPQGEEVDIDDGGFTDETRYRYESNRTAYRDQTIYTNRRIVSVLRDIIESSRTPPIIILESDHGPTAYRGLQNRMGNFLAYYFPGREARDLAYPFITPVNSFRLVFNAYFGGNYPLLEDVSYYSNVTSNFNYEIVPNTCIQE